MFLGHFAVALAAKKAAPAISLGTLFVAAQLADLVWPVLVIAGVEQVEVRPGITAVTPLDFVHYPYSHSLVALLGWGAALGVGYYALRRGSPRAAVLLAAVVVSHWVLDFVVHGPDLPLAFGASPKLGLGIWDSLGASLAIELGLFAAAVAIYVGVTRAKDRVGRFALIGLVTFLALVYLASVFGPPPPSARAVVWTAMSMWLLVVWGYWVDRHRETA
jgi:hypothetical protein